ncbi:hypothetical protein HCN44_002894 [Aphidius gifuensis]|uniref:Rabphilin n=1 Tax=Aphidius gifuensis TaxID=684658 RepID=A0A834XRS1_APHGI|nr:hypothetical protein HCN44_002894 [Aphidius gifuensis]
MDNYYLNSSSGSARTKSAKWVCPNDRQLALRAKLKTGWSVKSASLDSRSFDYSRYSTASCPGNLSSTKNNQPLTEEERERIIEVIKKADALDLSEQERVGKLVDRLENMKKNVTVVTSTRASGRNCASRCIRGNKCVCCCALCGEKFSVLGAGPGLCRDCRNYVCQKCGIETTTSTSSTNINTNTLSTSPSAATNTGQQQPQQQQQTTTITIGSTTNLTDNVKQQQQQPTTPPAKIFLCRICTETREMWKKSGAWFFKSLPKYVLPEKKPRGGSRGSHWTLAGGSRSLEPSELDSSSDEDLSRRPTRTRSFLFYSKSLDPSSSSLDQNKQNNNDSDVDTDKSSRKGSFLNLNVPDNNQQQQNILLSPQNQLMVPNTSSAFSTSPTSPSPSSSLSPVPRSRSSSRLRDQKESQSSSSSSSPPPPPPPSTSTSQSSIFYIPFPSIIGGSCESINNNNNNNNNNDNNNNNNNGKIILMTSNNNSNNSYNNNNNKIISGERKSSIQEKKEEINNMIDNNNGTRKSRRQSISNINNNNEMENMYYQRDQDQSPQRHYQQRMENPSGMEKNEQKNYGNLEITLRYEPLYHCLQCKVERAKGLRATDIQGHTDSYCKLNVLPIDEEDKKTIRKCQRTKTVYKTRDPEYNEQLNFYEIIENDLKTNKALHVLIVLDDVGGRDCLGEVKFPLRELQPCQTKYYNVILEEHQDLNNQDKLIWGEDMSNGRGKIQLSLTYNTRRRALLVNIQRANNLLPMDSNGLSDPFVKLCLTRDIINTKKLSSTSLMPNSTSPKKKLSPKKIPKMSGITHTSSVKWKTLNPEWNEDFYFDTRLTELTEYALVITLWDKDFGKSNDYLGGLVLSCNSKGARLHQWIDAIKFPDHRHQASHELTEDITLYKTN